MRQRLIIPLESPLEAAFERLGKDGFDGPPGG
jgi:hypothetical protein